jgi:hypothetical protein
MPPQRKKPSLFRIKPGSHANFKLIGDMVGRQAVPNLENPKM